MSNHSMTVTIFFPVPAVRSGRGGARVTAVIAWGKRPVPYRTRKLSPTAPMVLHSGGCGRVGHRRTFFACDPRTPGPGIASFNGKTILRVLLNASCVGH